MIEKLLKRIEAMASAAKFTAELSTQRFLEKNKRNWTLADPVEKFHRFAKSGSVQLKLAAPGPRDERIPSNHAGPEYTHAWLPFPRLHQGLRRQEKSEGTGEYMHNYDIPDHAKRNMRGGEADAILDLPVAFAHEPGLPQERLATEGRLLDDAIHSRLSRWLGLRMPQLRVHTGPRFDELLNARNAHAMAWQGELFVRSDKYHPESAQGLALLGHEMTHVAQQLSNASLPAVDSAARYEQVAIKSEQHVHQRMRADRIPDRRMASGQQNPGVAPSPPVNQSGASGPETRMFADAGRSVPMTESAGPTSVLSDDDMSRIKQEVYRDIMQKIKIDIERGA